MYLLFMCWCSVQKGRLNTCVCLSLFSRLPWISVKSIIKIINPCQHWKWVSISCATRDFDKFLGDRIPMDLNINGKSRAKETKGL